ncbi:MAG: hypothetical protein HFI78_01675 [Lachnospiraceae bacterium]|jgi:hypothetical protein|nr:hypothetical protein [Lachnospiraceae bacterium]
MGRGGGNHHSSSGGRGFSSHRSGSGLSSRHGSRGFSSSSSRSSQSKDGPPRRTFGVPLPRRIHHVHHHRPVISPGGYGESRGRGGCCGCFGLILILSFFLVIFSTIMSIPRYISESILRKEGRETKVIEEESTQNEGLDGIRASKEEGQSERTQRKKLNKDACIPIDQVIEDTLDWIEDVNIVEEGINDFYEKTGIQPYLLICDNLDGKGGEITDTEAKHYLETLYDTLYDDEGHMIFVFMEYEQSEYIIYLYTGKQADEVMDREAREIFLNNADSYYTDTSLSDEEYFAKIFRESANNIMK